VKVPKKVLEKFNAILTDTVPIELEHQILMDHEYDGIRELDNNLPPWWTWGFIATIVFAVIYLFNYHVIGYSDLQIKAYDKEVIQANRDIKAYLYQNAMNVDETNVKLLIAPDDLAKGKEIFNTNCILCHKKTGEGDVGPNLTDKAWIYGFDIKDVFYSIKNGQPNGMPEHASKLNPVEIQQVSSYVLQLPFIQGTKPAQGDKIEK
jgi:cytochrome c oxidase cbb3-type subunit 3